MNIVKECDDPPCIHVVFDVSRKHYAVFIEDSEGTVLYIPSDKIELAYNLVVELKSKHYKEAVDMEIDELARKYLGAEALDALDEDEFEE
ncbi:MAG: hypothetical protein F7B59_02055 [Desulfurococcales archaeon]|nr:hypothetical protein [Desulfurococcales archaeon]